MEYRKITLEDLRNRKKQIDILLNKMHNNTITKEEYNTLQRLLFQQLIEEKYLSFKRNIKETDSIENKYPICTYSMDENPVIFISDTHLGSTYQDYELLDYVTNYAIKNNISTFIHLGDFIEGSCRYNRSAEALEEELEKALEKWPTEIQTKLLLGNHDFSTMLKLQSADGYFDNPTIDIIGLYATILNWQEKPVLLKHPVEGYMTLASSYKEPIFSMQGHSHAYFTELEKANIRVPQLSKDYKGEFKQLVEYGYTLNLASFIVGKFISPDDILLQVYRKDASDPYLLDEIRVNTRTRRLTKRD